MPIDNLYWNSIDFGSDEEISLQDSNMPSNKHYVDPWDLENYAYMKEHLDSLDDSDPNSGEFAAEANSTSFYYVPGDYMREQGGNYAAIDEIPDLRGGFERNKARSEYVYSDSAVPKYNPMDTYPDSEESPYGNSSMSYDIKSRWRKANMPQATYTKHPRDRSLSFSYGDYGYYPPDSKQEIYARLDEVQMQKESTLPIYDDVRTNRRKPRNFGLSNYGHLKIDYSYSWNNLNKYIYN